MRYLGRLIAIGALALSFGAGSAIADVVTTFDVSAELVGLGGVGCSSCTLGGTISIDVTNGSVTSVDITAPGTNTGPFTIYQATFVKSSFLIIDVTDKPYAPTDGLNIDLPVTTLVGYTGGLMCTQLANCADPSFGSVVTVVSDTNNNEYGATSGSLAATEVTPLPAALPLFATGLGALGLLGWRRKRKVAALAS